MSSSYYEQLDARWQDFATLTLKGMTEERHAICHAAFLVGAATLCNCISDRPDKMTVAEMEEFFADVESACSHEAAKIRRPESDINNPDYVAGVPASAPSAAPRQPGTVVGAVVMRDDAHDPVPVSEQDIDSLRAARHSDSRHGDHRHGDDRHVPHVNDQHVNDSHVTDQHVSDRRDDDGRDDSAEDTPDDVRRLRPSA